MCVYHIYLCGELLLDPPSVRVPAAAHSVRALRSFGASPLPGPRASVRAEPGSPDDSRDPRGIQGGPWKATSWKWFIMVQKY